jgi:hypothetical protein
MQNKNLKVLKMKKILFALAISGSVLIASQNSETLQNLVKYL